MHVEIPQEIEAIKVSEEIVLYAANECFVSSLYQMILQELRMHLQFQLPVRMSKLKQTLLPAHRWLCIQLQRVAKLRQRRLHRESTSFQAHLCQLD